MRRTPLKKQSKSTSAQAKRRIQALLRKNAILRDGGCVLRNYPEAGECGGYRNDGELILQAEHLISRTKASTYGDMRNIVCLCQRHHFFWKKQNSRLYWELIEDCIGKERWVWLKRAESDRKPYHFSLNDWINIEISLTQDLQKYETTSI